MERTRGANSAAGASEVWQQMHTEPGFSAKRLLDRCMDVPFFAHSYSFIHNMEHGSFGPNDLLGFAVENGLAGISLHINDGGPRSLSRLSPAMLEALRKKLEGAGLALHLEISSTARAEVDQVADIAVALGVTNIRLYARHAGLLSEVMERVYEDLCYVCERAAALDLFFDFEQHEDLRAAEIVAILERIGDPRVNALFDYGNSLNAYEEPLEALRILSPFIRQAHVKGARRTVEEGGWGQLGVRQGAGEDEMPNLLLLARLLNLGETKRQVISFALEQEVGYYAPPFRGPSESSDPLIAPREPSETRLDPARRLSTILSQERELALDQVRFNRSLARQLQAFAAADSSTQPFAL